MLRVFLVVLVLLLGVRPALAQSPGPAEDAAAEKRRGDEAMDALRYEEALERYTRAYEIGHDPAVLYNRGRVYQARGDFPKALVDLETFEAQASQELRDKVPKLAELLATVRGRVTTLTVKCNVQGASVLIRGTVVGTTPIEGAKMNSGPARVEVMAEGYVPYRSETELQGGSRSVIEVTLEPKSLVGTLSVTAAGPPATIFIDGEPAGVAPLEVQRPAGNHRILVRRESADDVETSAVLEAGQRKEVRFEAPPGKPLTKRWWFWTGVGAVVVGTVVTVILVTRSDANPSDGDGFQPGRVSGPLVAW